MSSDLLNVTLQFKGPFSQKELQQRLTQTSFPQPELPEEAQSLWEIWMSAERLDQSSADVSLSPSLFARLMEDSRLSGQLPLSEIDAYIPDTYQPRYFFELGQWSTPSRFDAAFLLDARMLPAKVDDFTVDTTAYGDGNKKNSFIFAPASPAKTGPVIPIAFPRVIVKHKGSIYVGGDEGLAVLEGKHFKKISLAKKQPKVHALCSDGDFLYAGAANGLYKLDGDELVATWKGKDGIPGRAVLTLSNFQNKIFVGASGGIAWISDGELTDAKKESSLKKIKQSCVDFNGTLWVGGDKALFYLPADGANLIRVSGYRAISSLTPYRQGVFADLFRGNNSIKARLSEGDVEEIDLGSGYLPAVGSIEGDLLFQNGGLVRWKENGPERLLLESFKAISSAEIDGKLWLLENMNGVCELLPESWDAKPTYTPPVPTSKFNF